MDHLLILPIALSVELQNIIVEFVEGFSLGNSKHGDVELSALLIKLVFEIHGDGT